MPVSKLTYLTATAETCCRTRPVIDPEVERRTLRDRVRLIAAKTPIEKLPPMPAAGLPDAILLPEVAAKLWRAFRKCFPSVDTLELDPAGWPELSRSQIDRLLAAPHPQDVPGFAETALDRGHAVTVFENSATQQRLRVAVLSYTSRREFAVDFERRTDERPWTLVRVSVDFGAEGSLDRAFALGFEYLGMPSESWAYPDQDSEMDPDVWSASELALLWSAAPEFYARFVDGGVDELARDLVAAGELIGERPGILEANEQLVSRILDADPAGSANC
jgi:hypothetical protein